MTAGRRATVAALVALAVLAGSGAAPAAAAPSTTPATTPTGPVDSAVTAASLPVSFVDDAGNDVTVTSIARIIPLNGDLAEVVFALGLGDNVVATDLSATFPPEADAKPEIGYQRSLQAEPILTFEPTVVLADELAGPPEVLDQLRATGVPVVVIERNLTLDGPAAKIRAVGRALGVPDRAEALATDVQAQIDGAAADPAPGHPRVLALYLRGDSVQLAFGQGSGIDALIAAAGGVDVGTELGIVDSRPLTAEAVLAAAPDAIIATTTGLESVGGIDGLLAIGGIGRTPAGLDGNIFTFEDQFLYGFGPRTGELLARLADQLRSIGASASASSAAVPATDATAATAAGGSIVPGADPDVDAAVAAYRAVFDSAVGFPDKARYLDDADALRATVEAYSAAGGRFGGISLVPTAVVIDGDHATVTYDVYFGSTVQYEALSGSLERRDGEWMVTRDEFCSFMVSARTPCE